MPRPATNLLRRVLPWVVSAAALGYVFGYAIDWEAIPEATARANLPLFVVIVIIDKLLFFGAWALLQGLVVRRFVEPVSLRSVFAVKGAAELVRTVNNPLADAAFFYGISRLTQGRIAAVVAVASIPFGCHFGVLLVQATLALPLLEGGLGANRDVFSAVLFGWSAVAAIWIAARLGVWQRILRALGVGGWGERVSRSRGELLPIVLWFAAFAVFDVLIQGLASRAFGIHIPWTALMARIPILYLATSIPSLGNFGVREIVWSELFSAYGSREALVAFALWVNAIFLAMHALIGALFVKQAIELTRGVREARREGDVVPEPLLRDSIDR